LKVLFVTDAHYSPENYVECLNFWQKISEKDFSVIIFLGDWVRDRHYLHDSLALCRECITRPIYSLLGNHDYKKEDSVLSLKSSINLTLSLFSKFSIRSLESTPVEWGEHYIYGLYTFYDSFIRPIKSSKEVAPNLLFLDSFRSLLASLDRERYNICVTHFNLFHLQDPFLLGKGRLSYIQMMSDVFKIVISGHLHYETLDYVNKCPFKGLSSRDPFILDLGRDNEKYSTY